MTPLWFWELEPNKDYWITLRDWMLYCADMQRSWVPLPTIPHFTESNWKIGTTLRIKLPTPEFMFPDE